MGAFIDPRGWVLANRTGTQVSTKLNQSLAILGGRSIGQAQLHVPAWPAGHPRSEETHFSFTMGGEALRLINAAHSRRVPRNRGKFWRGRTMQIIILIECRCHSGVWEKAGMKENGWESMECLEVGGRVGLERKGRM